MNKSFVKYLLKIILICAADIIALMFMMSNIDSFSNEFWIRGAWCFIFIILISLTAKIFNNALGDNKDLED